MKLKGKYWKVVKNSSGWCTCLYCSQQIPSKKFCVFIPRYIINNTKVGPRVHLACFRNFIKELNEVKEEEFQEMEKLQMVNNL